MKIKMYVSVVDGQQTAWVADSGELWTREVETGFVPTAGQHDVILWSTKEEGAEGGPLWSVKRVYMLADGTWAVELSRILVDPREDVRDCVSRHRASHPAEEWRIWWTENDGDPRKRLRAGGWRPYGEETYRGLF